MRALDAPGNAFCGAEFGGDVICWGWPDPPFQAVPQLSLAGQDLVPVSVSFDGNNKCGLKQDGTAVCWQGDLPDSASVLDDSFRFQSVSVFNDVSRALTLDGRPYCWGDNRFGEIGDATATNSPTSVAVRMP
jgi:hypothetical protein